MLCVSDIVFRLLSTLTSQQAAVDLRRGDFTSITYIRMQMIAKAVSTTGCAAITPFNFQKWFKIMTPGINSTAFLRSVMVTDLDKTTKIMKRSC